jgi:hypothetical protein
MVLEFFTSPVGIAAILSFFISSFGYVIIKMWAQPLIQYRLLKSRVRALLDSAENLMDESETAAFPAADIRKTAAKLSDCYSKTLPQWYQLMLSNRNESPDAAVADLMALANVKNRQHAPKRIAKVRAALQLNAENKKG